MNRIVFSVVVAFALAAFAVDVTAPKKELTAEERARRRELMMKKTGGIIDRLGEGKVVFVDCQSRIGESVVRERVENLHHLLKFNIEYKRGAWKMGDPLPDGATVAIYIVDDEKLPMSLVAVEAHWGVVNTVGLSLGPRFSRELTRVVTLTIGAAQSGIKTSPMQTVSKPSDLDVLLTDGFTPDSVSQIYGNAKGLGLTRYTKTSYLRACQEGWAPAPTNDYQKAIWDQVHEIPSNPIKIKFDPKKGK